MACVCIFEAGLYIMCRLYKSHIVSNFNLDIILQLNSWIANYKFASSNNYIYAKHFIAFKLSPYNVRHFHLMCIGSFMPYQGSMHATQSNIHYRLKIFLINNILKCGTAFVQTLPSLFLILLFLFCCPYLCSVALFLRLTHIYTIRTLINTDKNKPSVRNKSTKLF